MHCAIKSLKELKKQKANSDSRIAIYNLIMADKNIVYRGPRQSIFFSPTIIGLYYICDIPWNADVDQIMGSTCRLGFKIQSSTAYFHINKKIHRPFPKYFSKRKHYFN